jgi:acyl-CoA thioesterase-1
MLVAEGARVSMGDSGMRMRVEGMRRLACWLLLAGSLLVPALACARGTADGRGTGPVLVLGDSLSAEHNIPAGSGWVSLLGRRIDKEIVPPPAVVNASISGETTAGALVRLPGLLEKHRPSVLVIELGGNDALRGLAPAQLRGNLERMLALAGDAGAKVLLLGIDVPPNYGPAYRERLRRTYAELAAGHHGTGLVPFFLEGVALQPGMMQADGLHPTAAAQPRLVENVWPALKPML